MAHFAEIDQNNIVLRVVVVDDAYEADGVNWCADFFGGDWVQTSYNATIRKNFAGAGFSYDANLDAFIAPQPFSSWVLDEINFQWVPPVPKPNDGMRYAWNEQTLACVVEQ